MELDILPTRTRTWETRFRRLSDFFASHHLDISNTFFQQQDSHAYTRYKWGDQRIRSQIDYIITRRKEIRNTIDTRVIPSENVSIDHRMFVATIRKETRRNSFGRTFQGRSVNVKKLMKPDINRKYQEEISYKLAQLPNKLNSAEKEWIDFKDTIQRRAEKMGDKRSLEGSRKRPQHGGTRRQDKLRNWKSKYTRSGWKIQHHRTKSSISQPEMHANKL